MYLDFDTDTIRKNKIELLDCQVDLILRSLEFYSYTFQFIYPRSRYEFETPEAALRISLVRNTYEQIASEYRLSQENNPIIKRDIEEDKKDKIKKIA